MTETDLHGLANAKTIGFTPFLYNSDQAFFNVAPASRSSMPCPNPPTCYPSPNPSQKTQPSTVTPTVMPGPRIT